MHLLKIMSVGILQYAFSLKISANGYLLEPVNFCRVGKLICVSILVKKLQ